MLECLTTTERLGYNSVQNLLHEMLRDKSGACPECRKVFTLDILISHVSDKHNFSEEKVVYLMKSNIPKIKVV